MDRRHFLKNTLAALSATGLSAWLPSWAHSARQLNLVAPKSLSGSVFDLSIGRAKINVDGRHANATAVNGTVPAPLLRWREGDEVTLRVANSLDTDTSIHWHGILIPFYMDGVPGVSFPGIKPGETFVYRFPLRQAGTYWYHSHSGLQEQEGVYGPIIIDPAGPDPVQYDREYVMVLSDWTFMNPHHLFAMLKKHGESLNYQQRTVMDFLQDTAEMGFGPAVEDRMMWGEMRMMPTDIADVTGETYTYLINGHGPQDNWTALFQPGERVRLRIINAAAMTIFNIRIPGLPMTVVQADGLNVEPVETDEFQIGVAETYDVVLHTNDHRPYSFIAESIDRSGLARATITPELGLTAAVPPLRERPTLTMRDMGMAGHHAHGTHGSTHGEGHADPMGHGAADGNDTGHEKHHEMADSMEENGHTLVRSVGVANVAMEPTSRLDEPGLGLENVTHRALTYAQLRSLEPNPDTRPPHREIEIHLTGNMERYMWSLDGVKFSEVVEPIVFHEGERLRMTLVNDTMMSHPIHLHGMFFDVVNGGGNRKPRKHTIIVKPGERLSLDITANEVGDWAFHCHLLYHMHAGMMQVVSVRPKASGPSHESGHHSGHDSGHGSEHEPVHDMHKDHKSGDQMNQGHESHHKMNHGDHGDHGQSH